MRIVHLVHYFPPEFRGGTEACVEALAAAQRRRGDEPTVVAGSDERDAAGAVRRESVDGQAVLRVLRRPDENYSMDHRRPRVAEQVLAEVDRLDPDVIHVHHLLNLSGDLGARLAASGRTVVATLHDFTTVCARFFLARPDGESCAEHFPLPSPRCVECVLPDFPAGRAALEGETRARGDTARGEAAAWSAAIAPSRFVAGRWRRSGLVDDARMVVVPHPAMVAPGARPAARPRDDGRLVLATWGHLAPAKGVADLLAALARAGDPRLALIVLGEPVDRAHGEELAAAAQALAARGIDVELRGRYAADDLPALRGQADLAVFPSRAEETFGLVVAEARALGFGVLASERGALGELLGDGGATVAAGDPEALAARLGALLDDPATVAAWAAAPAPEVLTSDEHAQAVARVYAQAARGRVTMRTDP